MIEFKRLLKSIRYALRGVRFAFKEEQNLRIHVFASVFVIAVALFLNIRVWEIIILILLIFAVLILEMINTIFERLADMLQPRLHTYVKIIKDMMAATVLMAVIGSAVIGVIIFFPYLAILLK